MLFCVNCENQIEENYQICSKCGNQVISNPLIKFGEKSNIEEENIDLSYKIDETISTYVSEFFKNSPLLKPSKFTSTKIHTHPNIPEKEIYNFLKDFSIAGDFEVKVYFDATLFGKGDEGLAVIEKDGENFLFLRIPSMESIILNLKNNGTDGVELFFISRETTKVVLSFKMRSEDVMLEYKLQTYDQTVAEELYEYLAHQTILNKELPNQYFS